MSTKGCEKGKQIYNQGSSQLCTEDFEHANMHNVQFPITLWCQNKSTTQSGAGESASCVFQASSPWLPPPVWLKLSHLMGLLKRAASSHWEYAQICFQIRCCYLWRWLFKFNSLICNQGTETQLCECVPDWRCVFKLQLERVMSRMKAITSYLRQRMHVAPFDCCHHNQSSEFESIVFSDWLHHMKMISLWKEARQWV